MTINRVVIVGRLTRDPELRATPGGLSVCSLRLAVNERVKVDGEWTERPGYFNVTAFGGQGESCSRYLTKGREVVVDGRLRWREWQQEGQKREAVEIVAEQVQFVGGKAAEGAAAQGDDDDIPF